MSTQVQIYNNNAHFEDNTVFYKKRVLVLQGDIALLPIDEPILDVFLPESINADGKEVTLGAATGHAHTFQGTGTLYALPTDADPADFGSPFTVSLLHVAAPDTGRLVHLREGGHRTHQVLGGWYAVILQHQIEGVDYRRVID